MIDFRAIEIYAKEQADLVRSGYTGGKSTLLVITGIDGFEVIAAVYSKNSVGGPNGRKSFKDTIAYALTWYATRDDYKNADIMLVDRSELSDIIEDDYTVYSSNIEAWLKRK
jgi:hypothetical protein